MNSFHEASINLSSKQNDKITNDVLKTELKIQELLNKFSVTHPIYEAGNTCSLEVDKNFTEFHDKADQLKQMIREFNVIESEEKEELESLKTALEKACHLIKEKEKMENLITSNNHEKEELLIKLESITKQTDIKNKKMALFSGITNIHWQNSSENELVGFIDQPKKKDIVPFSFDLQTTSQFDITNSLWDKLAMSNTDCK